MNKIITISIFSLLSAISFAQSIAAGGDHSLAICIDSTVWTWGRNRSK